MTFDEIKKGQRVRIVTVSPKHRASGTVWDKEIIEFPSRTVERVYVNTDRNSRRLCNPSILEEIKNGNGK